jgi:uncharacterized protein YcgI (DUF1989 family)
MGVPRDCHIGAKQTVVQDLVVPRCSGKAMHVRRGQIFRAIAHEGKQVLDLTFLNAHNYREHFSAELSAVLNSTEGVGGYYRLATLYSKPPYENVMATVTSDIVGDGLRGGDRGGHYIDDGHCTRRLLEFMGFPDDRTCSDNFADAFAEIGIRQEDTFDCTIFNVWMNSYTDSQGDMQFARPLVEKGDCIDFLAHMDLVAVFSLCPLRHGPCNDYQPKALRFQILDEDLGGAVTQ